MAKNNNLSEMIDLIYEWYSNTEQEVYQVEIMLKNIVHHHSVKRIDMLLKAEKEKG